MISDWQNKIKEIAGQLKLNVQHGQHPDASPADNSYRILFNGSPEKAQTFASHLGSAINKKVHTIDSPTLTANYIGETEKHLDQLFTGAEQGGWILLFDEADSLFGKRTDVKDGHDKYANQKIYYLLQRIQNYNGPIVLATNKPDTIDPHFLSRFHMVLH